MGGRVGTEVDVSQVGFCPRAKSPWGLVLGEALLTQPTGREAGGQKLCGPRPTQACTSTGRGLPSSFFTAAPPPSHWSTCWDAPDSLSAHQAPKLGGGGLLPLHQSLMTGDGGEGPSVPSHPMHTCQVSLSVLAQVQKNSSPRAPCWSEPWVQTAQPRGGDEALSPLEPLLPLYTPHGVQ